MSSRFQVPVDSSSPPSTPDRHSSRHTAGPGGTGRSRYVFGNDPSTTPAGPPPSSHTAKSFTPAGAPSASYLGSSIMRGMTSGAPKPPLSFSMEGGDRPGNTRNLFTGGAKPAQRKKPAPAAPLGRSIRGPTTVRGPSGLSRSVLPGEEEESESESESEEEEEEENRGGSGTFGVPYDESYDDGEEESEEEEEEEEEEQQQQQQQQGGMRGGQGRDEHDDYDADMWLDMPAGTPRGGGIGDESDLMMLNTPAATERVRREAEDIFRASSMNAGAARRRDYKFAALAKDVYSQMGTAELTEPPQVILGTEAMINRLYDDGVGENEDDEKLDDTLATVASRVAKLWQGYVDKLPQPQEDHAAEIGPGPYASAFENANYLANLALQLHHSRYEDGGQAQLEPLPETLFRWLEDHHNLYAGQVEDVLHFRPSPACHSLFWQSIFIALLRGKVADAVNLLRQAGWGHVQRGQRGSDYAYTGQALENVQRAVEATVQMLESCPGFDEDWEIWSSDWTLFRVRAQGSLEHLRRFAEGKDNLNESTFAASRGRASMAGLARRAESQVPWDIYENLCVIFDIVLGSPTTILGTAQDWCEATIGLFGWWDERRPDKNGMPASMSRSQALVIASPGKADVDAYLDRLARAFHMAMEADFQINAMSAVEVGMASIFEDNIKAVVGILRGWSLPVASAVAEIASLGRWMPPHQPSGVFGMEDLDMDDLEVLGMDPRSPDELDGIKDSTLVQYAESLAVYEELSSVQDKSGATKDGWELAINVLGRMDSPERSEEMVGSLVRMLLEKLDVDSSKMVDRIWELLNGLGMIPYAEETVETYGDILKRDSHRYGDAMRYYALAHRPAKVREVMNLLISYSLVQSAAYPPTADLDDYLHQLLADRNKTLERFAARDLEAAELLGKMLSGYASLRQFYDIRDDAHPTATARQQAAAALVSVIASSDDNIRGGLYDQTRDGIVSEDFLLALLGEATAFVSDPANANIHYGRAAEPAITLDQIDVMLKAVEDLQAVGGRVYGTCDDFLGVVLAAVPGGLKGGTPADLMTSAASGGSYVLGGSSVMVSQLHKSLSGGALKAVKRGWDWRKAMAAKSKGEDVLRRLRLGLAKDLAALWLAEADGGVW